MITRPSASTPAVTGDSCGVPSFFRVASTALWCVRTYSIASSMSITLILARCRHPGQPGRRSYDRRLVRRRMPLTGEEGDERADDGDDRGDHERGSHPADER